ncbi:MAG: serine/threonine-protein kinase [Acidobacteria bacterium]|nr:serine/threonine-protein kinase [Acidobacteriota bacterium]MDA1236217.1 serine/threonine-protein kinase [Acidobacteriota bacterium]
MAFRVGQTVGGYRFLRVLDAAGAAMVYEVENEIAGRKEILKLLPSGFEQDRNRVDRFLREAKIHSRLSHPNIAEFYSGIQLDGQLVMTMEALQGESLKERIADGSLTVAQAIDVAGQALAALDYAHQQEVVHREITPATIFIGPDGVVKLTGLGLAKQEHDPALTQVGTVVGAVHYMSPEQVKGQRDIDGRADIYALGAVLYEAATGRKPFDSQSQFDIIQAQVMQAAEPPHEVSAQVSEALSQVILKALEKDRGARYQTAGQFREALVRLGDAPVAAENAEEADGEALRDMHQLARKLEFARGPIPGATPTPVLQSSTDQDADGALQKHRRPLPSWTQSGPAAMEAPKPAKPLPVQSEPAVSLWGLEGWTKKDLVMITVLAFVMSAAAVVALMVWLGL